MATKPLSPPPINSALEQKSGPPAQAWARWFQELWSKQRELAGGSGGGGGGGLAGLTAIVTGHTTAISALTGAIAGLSSGSLTLTENNSDSRDDPSAILIVKNTGLTGSPMFAIGNPYVAGVGLNAMGVWYQDDGTGEWRLCFSWEQSGTFASVLDGVRRSAFEAFSNHGDFKPATRLFEASSQMMQLGAGGFRVAPGGAVRSSGVLTLTCATVGGVQQEHKMGVGQQLFKGAIPGYPGNISQLGQGELWGPSSTTMVVASVVDVHTLTVTDARSNYTNTDWLSFSTEPATDVAWGRDSYGTFVVFTKNGPRMYVGETGIVMPTGLGVNSAGSALQLGAGGIGTLELTADMVHVQNGKDFYQEGTYRSTGWFNGGGETQTTQEVFVVGTGSGDETSALRQINGKDWMRLMVVNDAQGGSHTLTVSPYAGDTIKGGASLVLPAYAGATLVSQGTNWEVFYHPPPP